MLLNTEPSLNDSREEFCLALKAARERRRVTLREIAETTKIPASLFAALERGDLRRWPKGLFRRSFFRDYARTIGLPTAELCDEFVRLFPDDESRVSTKGAGAVDAAAGADELRLVLDAAWRGPRKSVPFRLLAAVLDAAAVILVSTALAWAAGIDPLATAAIVSIAYFIRPAGQVMHLILEWTSEQSWRSSAWWPSGRPLQLSLRIPSARTYSRRGGSPSQKAVLISTSSSRPMEVET